MYFDVALALRGRSNEAASIDDLAEAVEAFAEDLDLSGASPLDPAQFSANLPLPRSFGSPIDPGAARAPGGADIRGMHRLLNALGHDDTLIVALLARLAAELTEGARAPRSAAPPPQSSRPVAPQGASRTPAAEQSGPASTAAPGAFEPNRRAVEAARNSPLGAELQRGAQKNAPIYRDAAEKTGVPAAMIAAIHFNEGHMGAGVGPESGFGLDPRYVSTQQGNAILARYGLGSWERGTGSDRSKRQSAVIAADMLKTSAKAAGVDVRAGMSERDAAVAIHAYGTGSASKSTKRAQETGRGFMFDTSDAQPHPKHPGGTSVGKDGQIIKVPPGYKKGLLRWDVAIPLLDEQLGGKSIGKGSAKAEPSASKVEAPQATKTALSRERLEGLPPRSADALSGTEVKERLAALPPGADRERFIQEQIESGNIPESARQLVPVTVQRKGADGKMHQLTMNVMPDYLAIGSDQDNVRVPMTPATAQKLADKTGATLPTAQMADDIHAAADKKLHLDPIQWKPGAAHGRYMMSGSAAIEHDQRIDRQLGGDSNGLLSGHKKDIVIPADRGKVAIYGARYADGRRVQPYSNVHEAAYADYSHGARLVGRSVVVDGRPMDIRDVLNDPNLAPLASDRGPIKSPSY